MVSPEAGTLQTGRARWLTRPRLPWSTAPLVPAPAPSCPERGEVPLSPPKQTRSVTRAWPRLAVADALWLSPGRRRCLLAGPRLSHLPLQCIQISAVLYPKWPWSLPEFEGWLRGGPLLLKPHPPLGMAPLSAHLEPSLLPFLCSRWLRHLLSVFSGPVFKIGPSSSFPRRQPPPLHTTHCVCLPRL